MQHHRLLCPWHSVDKAAGRRGGSGAAHVAEPGVISLSLSVCECESCVWCVWVCARSHVLCPRVTRVHSLVKPPDADAAAAAVCV